MAAQPILSQDWMDERQLAARLGLQAATLKRWRAAGQGPRFVKPGRVVFYVTADVEEWLQSRRKEPMESRTAVPQHTARPVVVAGRFGRRHLKSEGAR